MPNIAWRTLIVQAHNTLNLRDEQIVFKSENGEEVIPVEQIREILIMTDAGSISFPLLIRLSELNTKVVFCDRKKNPVSEINPYFSHFEAAGRLMDQAAWTKRKKEAIWRKIVKMKISQQICLLQNLDLKVPPVMKEYYKQVQNDDVTNREAAASKVFFNALFGRDFRRFAADDINAGLNYGYTILCSAFNRTVTMMGYSTALGIHHCNRQNPYNFSCDLMEPFRPFVDRIVYHNKNFALDGDYRLKLISLLCSECVYEGKSMDMVTAIEMYVRDIAKGMDTPRYHLGEIGFAEASGSNTGDV